MNRDVRASRRASLAGGSRLLLAGAGALLLGIRALGGPAPAVRAGEGDAIERIALPRACYLRLPDLPEARYGGFGAYNPETRVLSYAGGGAKLSDGNTMTYHDLFAIRLDGQAGWQRLPYSSNLGYTRQNDRGCREMASVQIEPGLALSVMGKDGCDNGRIDAGAKGGDLVSLTIGRDASAAEVRWQPGGNAAELPTELAGHNGRLARLFAAYDTLRQRVVFGQGSFDTASLRDTLDEVFAARRSGNLWRVQRLRPRGTAPSPRYGSCAAYVHQPESGLDGLLVLGGKEPASAGGSDLAEVWWLDFARREAGEWSELSARFTNLDALGPRREGACAYDARTGRFYSWMGRASKDRPDGAKRSGGLWSVDLGPLADPGADLRWEQLAPDDLEGLTGRRLLPSVWDPIDGRLFAVGGRNDLDELADVWAIYPELGPERCATLDPFLPLAGQSLPAPSPTPEPSRPATRVPPPTFTPPGPPPPSPSAQPVEPTPSAQAPEPQPPGVDEPRPSRCYLPVLSTGERH